MRVKKGVELATGEWVLFVDSDDTMPADALQRLFQVTSEDTDIVVGFCRKKRLWRGNRLSPACYRKLLIKGRTTFRLHGESCSGARCLMSTRYVHPGRL